MSIHQAYLQGYANRVWERIKCIWNKLLWVSTIKSVDKQFSTITEENLALTSTGLAVTPNCYGSSNIAANLVFSLISQVVPLLPLLFLHWFFSTVRPRYRLSAPPPEGFRTINQSKGSFIRRSCSIVWKPVSEICRRHGMSYHSYADDTLKFIR